MDHLGHGLALEHAVFRHPVAARFDSVEKVRPKHYEGFVSPLYPKGVPAKYELVKFETEKPAGWNPTIVSHEGFFTDVPGFENLAEGNSAKALGSLALARQGRYFYWGYSVDPERMTKGAQASLVNALYYMHSVRDSRTVPFVVKTRAIFRVYTWLGRDRDRPYLRGVQEHFPGSLTARARQDYTPTFEGADAWVAENLPYVFAGKEGMPKDAKYGHLFDVDEDAKALRTPNRSRASLERWIALADEGKGEDAARARRCLTRYVHPEIYPASGTWSDWYAKQKHRICFVDSTGFWWQPDPRAVARESRRPR